MQNDEDQEASRVVLRSIWVNTANADTVKNEEILAFHFQIQNLYITLQYCSIATYRTRRFIQKFLLQPIFLRSLIHVCSVQKVDTLQSGYARTWQIPNAKVRPWTQRTPKKHGSYGHSTTLHADLPTLQTWRYLSLCYNKFLCVQISPQYVTLRSIRRTACKWENTGRLQVLTFVLLNIQVFWDVMLYWVNTVFIHIYIYIYI
jgi:hypothetical protein